MAFEPKFRGPLGSCEYGPGRPESGPHGYRTAKCHFHNKFRNYLPFTLKCLPSALASLLLGFLIMLTAAVG